MKHIYVNLKRFEIPVELGGLNRLAPVSKWGEYIVTHTQEELKKYDPQEVEFVQIYPESQILKASEAKSEGSPIKIGGQACTGWTPDGTASARLRPIARRRLWR